MDPTKELSAIIGDLGVQVAYLQAQVRILTEENAALKQAASATTPAHGIGRPSSAD
jgi:antirestriction protein ArdC